MDSEESFLHGLPTYTPACLRLSNVLMECIIRLLPTQADRYQTCLIHPVWTTAAMNILWEWPHFPNENAIRAFFNTIRKHKRLALAVRHLNLCLNNTPVSQHQNSNSPNFSSNDENNAFQLSTRLVLCQHKTYQDSPLASPLLIMTVLQQCERIDTLSIYGWQLEATHLRLIAAYLPQLQYFRIIGSPLGTANSSSNVNNNINIKRIILPPLAASTLSKLYLYANYTVLPSRYMELESLRISLSHPDSLDKLCRGQHPLPKLRELMMANVGVLLPGDIDSIFHMFPQLEKLAMEDVKQPIASSYIVQSKSLKHLIIRAVTDDDSNCENKQRLEQLKNNDDSNNNHIDNDDDPTYPQSYLYSIFIENCHIQNFHFKRFTFNVDRLTRIRLHKCPSLTDSCFIRLCQDEITPLEELEIVECIHIGNPSVRALTQSPIICTLRTFEMRFSGHLRPEDVFELINAASSYQLSCVAIIGYPSISNSFLGRYSTEIGLVLDQVKIQLLVQHSKAPKERTLTSNQVIKLAKALNIDTCYLGMLMDQIQLEEEEMNKPNSLITMPSYGDYNETNDDFNNNVSTKEGTKLLHIKQNNLDQRKNSKEKMHINKHGQLNYSLMESEVVQKYNGYDGDEDDNNNYLHNGYLEQSDYTGVSEQTQQQQHDKQQEQLQQEHQHQYQNQNQQQHQLQSQENYQDREEHLQHYHQERQYYERSEGKEKFVRTNGIRQSTSPSVEHHPAEQIQNGYYSSTSSISGSGSGPTVDLGGWGMTSDLSWLQKNTDFQGAGDMSGPHPKSSFQNSYEHAWKQIAHKSPIVTAQQNNTNRHVTTVNSADGWGTPKANLAWTDEHLSYAHEILEEQKRTIFWNQSKDGEWTELSTQKNAAAVITSTPQHPPMVKSKSSHPTTPAYKLSKKKSYGADSLRRPAPASVPASRTTTITRKKDKAEEWVAFSASQLQQSEAKKRKSITSLEVEQLEVPDLITLNDHMMQPNPEVSSPMFNQVSPPPTSSNNVDHPGTESTSLLVDL